MASHAHPRTHSPAASATSNVATFTADPTACQRGMLGAATYADIDQLARALSAVLASWWQQHIHTAPSHTVQRATSCGQARVAR
jgi:hypothetical protein